ncbi:MAG: hypothetical protein RMK67_02760 [Chloroflexota bacterium]|nr:hypothetical protein [Chloroflexota bacterium]
MEKEELRELAREAVHARIREGVKAVIERVLEEEMREHLGAGHREGTPLRRGSGKRPLYQGAHHPCGQAGAAAGAQGSGGGVRHRGL